MPRREHDLTEKQKNIARLLTVSGIILAIIVIISLVYNVVTLVNLGDRKANLETEISRLGTVVENNDETIEYRSSDDYVERYAREYLNMIGENDVAYKGTESGE